MKAFVVYILVICLFSMPAVYDDGQYYFQLFGICTGFGAILLMLSLVISKAIKLNLYIGGAIGVALWMILGVLGVLLLTYFYGA